jgi:hypothetical protein
MFLNAFAFTLGLTGLSSVAAHGGVLSYQIGGAYYNG